MAVKLNNDREVELLKANKELLITRYHKKAYSSVKDALLDDIDEIDQRLNEIENYYNETGLEDV